MQKEMLKSKQSSQFGRCCYLWRNHKEIRYEISKMTLNVNFEVLILNVISDRSTGCREASQAPRQAIIRITNLFDITNLIACKSVSA